MKTVNKTLLIAFLGCLLHQVSYAQLNPSRVNASDSRDLPGVIQPLGAEQTWSFSYPTELQFWNSEIDMNLGRSWTTFITHPQRMRARLPRRGELPDYTFMLITNGLHLVEVGEPRPNPGGGMVFDIIYTFPAVLQVSDLSGTVLKSFVISGEDEERATTIHPAFFHAVEQTTRHAVNSTIIPIAAGFTPGGVQVALTELYAILARAELNTYITFVNRAATIISLGYGAPRTAYRPMVLEVGRRQRAQFPEVNEKVDALKSAIDQFFATPFSESVMNRLIEIGEMFEAGYDPASSSSDVIQLYGFNAAMAFLFGGDSERAFDNFRVARGAFGALAATPGIFHDFYPILTNMHNLHRTRNDQKVMDIPVFTVTERFQMEQRMMQELATSERQQERVADLQALAARNVTNLPGYVMTNDGEMLVGYISIDFVDVNPTRSGIIDLDASLAGLGRFVRVKGEDRTRALRLNAVSYVMAHGRRFEPVTITAPTGARTVGILTGDRVANNFFMEVIHRTGNYTAFFSPYNNEYFVQVGRNENVLAFGTILFDGRESNRFFAANCPALQARVRAEEFTQSRESLIVFIDALAGCGE